MHFDFLFRVAKLRDDIMALRNECSSVYSKGRVLTTEQTKLMISGISPSLNSGFAQTLAPSMNSGLTQGLTPSLTPSSVTSGLSSGLTSRLTPSVTPAYTPGFPSGLVPRWFPFVLRPPGKAETHCPHWIPLMEPLSPPAGEVDA